MKFIQKLKKTSIREIINKESSLAAGDYRGLILKNTNTFSLKDCCIKILVGKEIGSNSYMKLSNNRFLKTININGDLLIDEKSIEYCNNSEKANPKKDDILIVKDGGSSGIGEVALYPYDNKDNKDSISAGIISITLNKEYKYYVFGILKSSYFKSYVDLNTPQGSIIRHAGLIPLDCKIPFPSKLNSENPADVEKMVSLIVQNIMHKETQIKLKNNKINNIIDVELIENKIINNTKYSYPRISEIQKENRLDSLIYKDETKEIIKIIMSYNKGFKTFKEREFKTKRGQNLALSVIGNSYYSNVKQNNFYQLITSTNISDERTLIDKRYLGNKNKLIEINVGDILLSATGNVDSSIGKSFVFCERQGKMCSNFNSFFLYKKNFQLEENIFISLMLSWFKYKGFYKNIVGRSNGGSLTESHFEKLLIPNFDDSLIFNLSKLYYNNSNKNSLTVNNYLESEFIRNEEIGIYQLNMEIFKLKEILNDLVYKIVMNEKIDIDLSY